ncbi:hypothetical protein ACH5RR_038240 [Cinchona calisaya]|uniref:Protein BRANCHLESS TRICHOME n=1 Tax=Cinchona calisaya TaxID=153742 RepID=A0ABD2XY03_9GENT
MEEMMMISRISSPESLTIESISNDPITTYTTNCPTWKLYENPFYTNTPHKQHHLQNQNHRKTQHQQSHQSQNKSIDHQLKQIHRLQLPVPARKIAASFWDLTFIRPFMDSELDIAQKKITELKTELEQERKARKKAEYMTNRLVRELSELKKGRESLERLCEDLAKEVSSHKAEMNRMHKEMEEERKMLRMAEVLREERLQMKLADAKLLLEEKLSELEATTKTKQMLRQQNTDDQSKVDAQPAEHGSWLNANINHDSSGGVIKSCALVEKTASQTINSSSNPSAVPNQRRASPEPENSHIKRGIKGFVEFPRVVRAIRCKGRHLGTKLECQRAQLRILLKQKTHIRSNTLITT